MTFVAWLPIIDRELNQKIRPDHLRYLDTLYKEGKIVLAGPFNDKTGGMVIYKADTEDDALRLASNDPAVTSGARTVEIKEWTILEFPIP